MFSKILKWLSIKPKKTVVDIDIKSLVWQAVDLMRDADSDMVETEVLNHAEEIVLNVIRFDEKDGLIDAKTSKYLKAELEEFIGSLKQKLIKDAKSLGFDNATLENLGGILNTLAEEGVSLRCDQIPRISCGKTDYSYGGPMGDEWPPKWFVADLKGEKFINYKTSSYRIPGFSDSLDRF